MKSIVTALVDPSGAADYGPDAHVLIWSELPVGAGGTIATDKPLRVPVTSTGLSTPPIQAGNYLIRMKLSTHRDALGPYPFTMPDGDGTTELWPLIAAGVNIPPDTPIQKIQEALAAYLIANPIDGAGLDQAAVDTRVQTVGDTRYAPVALADEVATKATPAQITTAVSPKLDKTEAASTYASKDALDSIAAAPGPTVILDSVPTRWDGARPIVPSTTIPFEGHSWAYSDNGLVEAEMTTLLGVPVRNRGIGGQTSTEVAIRTGAIIPLLTLAGNQIPADTSSVAVTISPSGDYRTNGSTAFTYPGTLAGVAGTLTETLQVQGSQPVWTFARTVAGDATPVPPSTPFLVTGPQYVDETKVIMAAQNNLYTVDATMRNVLRDFEAMVGALTPIVKRFLIVGEFTFPTDGDNATGGQLIRRNKMIDINTARAARWPNNFYDMRRDLIDFGMQIGGLTPDSDDILKITHDTTPIGILKSSADTHPSAVGYAVVGKLIAKVLVRKGWATYSGSTVPAAPVLAAAGGANQIVQTITAPADGGSAITDYVAQYRIAGTTRWLTYFDAIGTATTLTLTGLIPGSYETRVTAINAIGHSDPSNTVAVTVAASSDTTAPTVPGTPTATAGDGTVSLASTGSTDAVGVTEYLAYSNADAYTAPVATSATLPMNVTAPNGTAVSYKLAARDAAGNVSARSATSNTVTPQAVVAPTVYASDSFNRTDGAPGSTDSAYGGTTKAWTPESGLAIVGNALAKTSAGTGYCRLPNTELDVAIEVTLAALGASSVQLVVRRVDGSNLYRAIIAPGTGAATINKTVAGTNTQLDATPTGTFTTGSVVKFKANGSTLTLYKDGVEVKSVSDTSITTTSEIALGLADTTARFEDFKMTNI